MTAVEILNKHLLGKTSITQDTEGFVLAVVNAMEEYAALKSAPKLREVSDEEIKDKASELCDSVGLTGQQKLEYIAKWMRDLLKGGEQWISVEERLPENDQRVLFFTKGYSMNEIRKGVFISKDQFDRDNMFCDGAYFNTKNVSHWMPMPNKPQSDKKT